MANWTADNMPDLTGKIVIVTGGNSGLGLEAAKVFAAKGARTILACRDPQKASAAVAEIKQGSTDAIVEAMTLDLGNLESVKAFAAEANQSLEQIDLLVNNAGIMMTPYTKTTDGFESQFGVNHLGHFALTGLLLDKVNAAENGRVVNVSSAVHTSGTMDFDNLMFENGNYSPTRSYGRSKLANLLFTLELDKRLKASGSDTISVSVHPGVNQTNLSRYAKERLVGRIMMALFSFMMMDASQGALNTLRASVDPTAKGNEYYGPDGRGGFTGYPVVLDPSDDAKDADDAKRLWAVSEELTGVSYLS